MPEPLAAIEAAEPATYSVSTIRRREHRGPKPRVNGPADIHRLLASILRGADREHFYAVLLSTKNHVVALHAP